jgi:hypothetical protein
MLAYYEANPDGFKGKSIELLKYDKIGVVRGLDESNLHPVCDYEYGTNQRFVVKKTIHTELFHKDMKQNVPDDKLACSVPPTGDTNIASILRFPSIYCPVQEQLNMTNIVTPQELQPDTCTEQTFRRERRFASCRCLKA